MPAGQRRRAGSATIATSSSLVAASVTFTPSGVSSSAQASTAAMGKPMTESTTTKVTVQSGSPRRGRAMSAACITAKATAPYTATILKTCRRFSSAKKI